MSDAQPGAGIQLTSGPPVAGPPADVDDTVVGSLGEWHHVLLRVAGAVPDDLMTQARTWLAGGERVDVALAVAFATAATRLPVLEADAELIRAVLAAAGQDTAVVAELDRVDDDFLFPATPWFFTPEPLETTAGGSGADGPALSDLSVDPDALAALDPADRAVLTATAAEPRLAALWRAWRYPVDGPLRPEPRRVYIVSAGLDVDDDELPALTVRLQDALEAAGEEDPQVELCPGNWPTPVYQDTARVGSALLWAREPAVPIRLARVFDVVDPDTGPRFGPDRPTIDDEAERQRLVGYLDGAVPVLITTSVMADVLDPEGREVVPLSFRTDGRWIWTDTVTYYLETYGLAPDPDLLRHLRDAPPVPSSISDVALHRVLAFLEAPDAEEPVWTVPRPGGPADLPAPG